MPKSARVGFVVVEFNRASGLPGFGWSDEFFDTLAEAMAEADEARTVCDGRIYRYEVAEVTLIERDAAGA